MEYSLSVCKAYAQGFAISGFLCLILSVPPSYAATIPSCSQKVKLVPDGVIKGEECIGSGKLSVINGTYRNFTTNETLTGKITQQGGVVTKQGQVAGPVFKNAWLDMYGKIDSMGNIIESYELRDTQSDPNAREDLGAEGSFKGTNLRTYLPSLYGANTLVQKQGTLNGPVYKDSYFHAYQFIDPSGNIVESYELRDTQSDPNAREELGAEGSFKGITTLNYAPSFLPNAVMRREGHLNGPVYKNASHSSYQFIDPSGNIVESYELRETLSDNAREDLGAEGSFKGTNLRTYLPSLYGANTLVQKQGTLNGPVYKNAYLDGYQLIDPSGNIVESYELRDTQYGNAREELGAEGSFNGTTTRSYFPSYFGSNTLVQKLGYLTGSNYQNVYLSLNEQLDPSGNVVSFDASLSADGTTGYWKIGTKQFKGTLTLHRQANGEITVTDNRVQF